MLKTAAIFGNGMILQQKSTVAVFGETDCDCVEALWNGGSYEASISEGKWLVMLPTGDAKPVVSLSLTITGKKSGESESISFEDIILGEVWFAGGQSNMELELKDSYKGEEIAAATDYDYIRFYNVPKCPFIDDELYKCEAESSWQRAKGEPSRFMSAVGFYFAQKLQKTLDVPVGIIDCYWGGTSATCWVKRDKIAHIDEVQEYIGEWDEVYRQKPDEVFDKELAEYQAAIDDWVARLEALREKDPDVGWDVINEVVGPYPWPMPRGRKSPFRPFGLYETMVKRVTPYGVKGFIYYQGEEDCVRASIYSRLNRALIEQWREDFALPGEEDMKPFYLTQLPAYKGGEETGDMCWCVIREQQALCAATTPNTGVAVIIDSGEQENIHPLDKKTPGYRLAEQALENTYESEEGKRNCILKEAHFKGNECELIFEDTYGELCYRKTDGKELTAWGENIPMSSATCEGSPKMADNNTYEIAPGNIYGFEVSSDGENFYVPKLVLEGDRLILKGNDGETLSDVRYGWLNFGVVNVYNKAGVPMMPFWKRA